MRHLSFVSLLLFSVSLWARVAPAPVVELPNPDSLQFTFQACVRGEYRNNVFDINDGANWVTDDSWLLHRIRPGIEWQPVSWLHVTLQGQDVSESFSDRADIALLHGTEGDDANDLRLASLEFGNPEHLSLKLGRQRPLLQQHVHSGADDRPVRFSSA